MDEDIKKRFDDLEKHVKTLEETFSATSLFT